MKYILLITITLYSLIAQANYLDDNLRKLNWDGVDVVWLEDDQYPTYSLSIYFYAGALLDQKDKYGETELMFQQLTSGTSRYSKHEIVDALEFYGASYGANVTHEYATYSVSGLAKDLDPTMKMVCHMFKKATYPEAEFKKTKSQIMTALKNVVTNHGELANRVFRELSLNSTPFGNPVSGSMSSIQKISAKDLHDKLLFFTNKVKKKIYIKGPKSVLRLENVFTKDCGWSGKSNYVQETPVVNKMPENDATIYLVNVPNANQAQIRIGRYNTDHESDVDHELKSLASKHLGGGFTSKLMQELRVKRGLTYSVGAYISSQQVYGRSGISTFTKNPTLVETFKVIQDVLASESSNISEDDFMHIKRFIKGNYLFGLESTSSFLESLLFFDHAGRKYEEIYQFPNRIDEITKTQLQNKIGEFFNWENQIKVVVGSKDLKKDLEKAGYKVKLLDYKKYL